MLVWDDLQVFLATHRTRSHAAAARELQVASTTVGRRLAALEEAIGSRLFARTPDGLAPTAAAHTLLPRAERMEAEAIEADRALTGVHGRPLFADLPDFSGNPGRARKKDLSKAISSPCSQHADVHLSVW